jgi:uncharacterized protein (TIGR03000 family)
MKKFVGLAAVGVVAFFLAPPTPAAAAHVGRYGGWGLRPAGIGRGPILFGRARFGPSVWSPSPRFFGWRRGGSYYRYAGTYYYPYAVNFYPVNYGYAGGYYPYAETSYSAYYPPAPPVDGNAARIRMSVPSGAQVWFDGEATSQTGPDREFVSPPLTPGREYVYHVRVRWEDNNKVVERKRDVTVHAGDRVNLKVDK